MQSDTLLSSLRQGFAEQVVLREKRPGIYEVHAPLYHPDGDMVEIFVTQTPEGIRLTDYGMTMMRLSYSFELDTEHKKSVLRRILREGQVSEDDGQLYLDCSVEDVFPTLMQLYQTVIRVFDVELLRQEVTRTRFTKDVEHSISRILQGYEHKKGYRPLEDQTEYTVDYCFNGVPVPVYLYAVPTSLKCRDVILTCQHFRYAEGLKYHGVAVFPEKSSVGKKDRLKLNRVIDRQYNGLGDFSANAPAYFEQALAQ